jgi:hypothetical protein
MLEVDEARYTKKRMQRSKLKKKKCQKIKGNKA